METAPAAGGTAAPEASASPESAAASGRESAPLASALHAAAVVTSAPLGRAAVYLALALLGIYLGVSAVTHAQSPVAERPPRAVPTAAPTLEPTALPCACTSTAPATTSAAVTASPQPVGVATFWVSDVTVADDNGAGDLFLQVTAARLGALAAQTEPDAACIVTGRLPSGAPMGGLGLKSADAAGVVSWSHVAPRGETGQASYLLSCSKDGRKRTMQISVNVA